MSNKILDTKNMEQDDVKVKLFISHSSKTDDNRVKLTAVCDHLKTTGYDVLVDQIIPGGDEWRRRLFEWMAECDAAIILMSVDAFDSSWVQAESTILSWRRYIDANFTLICVLLDDVVSPADMTDDPLFSVTQPAEYNLIRHETLNAQLEKIKSSLEGVKNDGPPTPFNDLIQRISDILQNLGPDPNPALQRAWNRLVCVNKPMWNPNMDFADALARLLVREPENALQNLYKLLFEIKQLIQSPHDASLLDIIRGLWVKPEAASMLAFARSIKKSAAINCQLCEFTGASYARRVWAYPHECKVILVDDHVNFKQNLDDEICKLCFPEEDQQTALLRLNSEKTTKKILLVFTYKSTTELTQLEDLSKTITTNFCTISVVFATGPELPAVVPDSVTPIAPPLLPNEEVKQYIIYANIDDFIHQ